MQDMNIVQHKKFCFNKVLTWANLSQNKMIGYLKQKIFIDYDLETVVKLTELKLFCENELKECNSLFLSGAWKEDDFIYRWGNFA